MFDKVLDGVMIVKKDGVTMDEIEVNEDRGIGGGEIIMTKLRRCNCENSLSASGDFGAALYKICK